MINSVPPVNKNNPFDMVSPQISDNTYWLNDKKIKRSSILKIPHPGTVIMPPEEAQKTHNTRTIGLSIAAAVVFIAGGVYFFLNGGPKGFAKSFQKLRQYFEKKLQKSKLGGLQSSEKYEYILGKVDKLSNRAEAVNNWNTIKDYFFKKLMYGSKGQRKFTKKIHIGITDFFEKVGLKTVANSYKKSAKNFNSLEEINKALAKELHSSVKNKPLTINGVTKTSEEWLAIIEKKGRNISDLYKNNFNSKAREERFTHIKELSKKLEESFEKDGTWWFLSKETFSKFVADSKILPQKIKMQNEVKNIRHEISYSIKDLYSDADNFIMKISSALGTEDKIALKQLNNIRQYLKESVKSGEINTDILNILTTKLNTSLKEATKSKSNEAQKIIQESKDSLLNLCGNFKRGEIQDILDIYKELLSPEKYAEVEKAYKKAVKSLDNSIKIETEDLISKERDLTMGSAPTDIITMLASVAGLGYYLGITDDNKQRRSVLLKYGIPAIAGIGVTLYSNARLFAGSKSMILGTVSSLVLNKIGSIANDIVNNKTGTSGNKPDKTAA